MSSDETRVRDELSGGFDVLVVGGGILGTATALLLADYGKESVVLRLTDNVVPKADTLRNQGWLQSGAVYRIKDVGGNEEAWVDHSRAAYFGGRGMLRDLGMPIPTDYGILQVKAAGEHRTKIERKIALLGYKEFYELRQGDACDRMRDLFEDDSIYFNLPDCPFDEAEVLRRLRDYAVEAGVRFIDLTHPVSFDVSHDPPRINIEGLSVEPGVLLVAAGAGIAPCLEQLGQPGVVKLRHTPLLVYTGDDAIGKPPLFVDYERGFSSVRHLTPYVASGAALVIGTRIRADDVAFCSPDKRRVTSEQINQFRSLLSAPFAPLVSAGRFTAGFELMPTGASFLSTWWHEVGDILFASPGRATIGWQSAHTVVGKLVPKLRRGIRGRIVGPSPMTAWETPIHMHFSDRYSFNDAIEVQ